MTEWYHEIVYALLPLEMDIPSKDQVLLKKKKKRRDLKTSLEI